MTESTIRFVIASAAMLCVVSDVSAKGPTVKLTVAGPGLAQPVDVTQAEALVHVWSDDFLSGPAVTPEQTLPRYVVSFYVQPSREGTRLMYVVHYAVDPVAGEAFVYLPGRGEEGYQLNVSTILRDGQDGKWHRAPERWARAIGSALP